VADHSSLPLRAGAQGEAVRDLQRRLAFAGHAVDDSALGIFDAPTEQAVRDFQEGRGLHPDGICGRQTWSALVEAGYRTGDRLLYHRRPMLRGDDVAELQRRLCALGFDAGRVDGIFGPATELALREFQRNAGLTTDGVCGRDTLAALDRLGTRTDGSATVAELRQTEELQQGATATLANRLVVVGETGGAGALIGAISRHLAEADAHPITVHHPDESLHAQQANELGADVYVGFDVHDDLGAEVAFFAVPGFTSIGGQGLATLLCDGLVEAGWSPVRPQGMRLPVLRETRMPAVRCRLGPPTAVVVGSEALADVVVDALTRWSSAPVAPPAEG
jgi:N-acetylmuramoyl-L-alanine amidase